MMKWEDQLKNKTEEQKELLASVEKNNRGLTAEETEQFNKLQTDVEALQNSIDMRNAIKKDLSECQEVEPPKNTDSTEVEYKNAWLKWSRGSALTEKENILIKQNASVTDGGTFIPTTIADQIFSLMAETHPILSDVNVLNVKGNFSLNVHTGITSGDADVVEEGDCLDPEENTFATINLGGFTYGKLVEIPWAMRAMAMPMYEKYLVSELAQRLSSVLAKDVIYGDGSGRITGIVTFVTDKLATNIVSYTDQVKYSDLTGIMAKLSKTVGEKCIYVNENTFWSQLCNVIDTIGRPIFINDPATGAIRTTFGVPVKIESTLKDGEILVGRPREGYILNYNQDVTVVSQDNARCLSTDIVGYVIADGHPTTEYAWAELKNV